MFRVVLEHKKKLYVLRYEFATQQRAESWITVHHVLICDVLLVVTGDGNAEFNVRPSGKER